METIFGALNLTEGMTAIGVLTPGELPPGNISWTAREIHSADQAFAAADPSLLNTWLLTSAAFLAWKEATFMATGKSEDKKKDQDDESTSRS